MSFSCDSCFAVTKKAMYNKIARREVPKQRCLPGRMEQNLPSYPFCSVCFVYLVYLLAESGDKITQVDEPHGGFAAKIYAKT